MVALEEAKIIFYSHYIDAMSDRATWTQERRDIMWNNVERTKARYNSEFERTFRLYAGPNPHRESLQ